MHFTRAQTFDVPIFILLSNLSNLIYYLKDTVEHYKYLKIWLDIRLPLHPQLLLKNKQLFVSSLITEKT